MTLFDRCIEVVLKTEGKYQCDPDDIGNWIRDDGGRYNNYLSAKKKKDFDLADQIVSEAKELGILKGTKYGIAARYFPDLDIKNLTIEQAKEIYYKSFWKPMNLEGINDELLVLHVFDHGVNAGKKTSIRMLQRIIEVKDDGVCGSKTTIAANTLVLRQKVIEGYGLLRTLCDYFIYERRRYYANLTMRRPVTKKYLSGWYNRVTKCRFY